MHNEPQLAAGWEITSEIFAVNLHFKLGTDGSSELEIPACRLGAVSNRLSSSSLCFPLIPNMSSIKFMVICKPNDILFLL